MKTKKLNENCKIDFDTGKIELENGKKKKIYISKNGAFLQNLFSRVYLIQGEE